MALFAVRLTISAALFRFDEESDIPQSFAGSVMAFNGSAPRFILAALQCALGHSKSYWLCDHLNYGPLAMLLSRGRYVVYTHAYELMLPVSALRRFALRRAKKVICISEFCESLVLQLGVPREKIHLLPHGADFPVLEKEPHSLPRILFVGRLDRHYKGQDHLLESCKILKMRGLEFEMRFAGGGQKLETFRQQAREMGVDGLTNFLGFVPDEQLDQEFADADIFAMPSNGEGFGLVYLQAMANSLPCICADGDAAKEIVMDCKTGFVVPYANPEKLADALEKLLTDPALRRRMGEAGRKRYELHYTEAAFEKRFLAMLEELGVGK
jgi:phosphatidylinositol alpha-1,6-mannosyltransferase